MSGSGRKQSVVLEINVLMHTGTHKSFGASNDDR